MQQQRKDRTKRKVPTLEPKSLVELIKQITALIIALTGLANILMRIGTILKWW